MAIFNITASLDLLRKRPKPQQGNLFRYADLPALSVRASDSFEKSSSSTSRSRLNPSEEVSSFSSCSKASARSVSTREEANFSISRPAPLVSQDNLDRFAQLQLLTTIQKLLRENAASQTVLNQAIEAKFDDDLKKSMLMLRALLGFRTRNFDLCVSDLQQVLADDPSNRTAIIYTALAYDLDARSGEPSGLKKLTVDEYYSRSVEFRDRIKPAEDDVFAQIVYACLHSDSPDHEIIITTLTQADKKDPQNEFCQAALAAAYFAKSLRDSEGFTEKAFYYARKTLLLNEKNHLASSVLQWIVANFVGYQDAKDMFPSLFSKKSSQSPIFYGCIRVAKNLTENIIVFDSILQQNLFEIKLS